MDYASLAFRFPTGGVVKRAAFQEQPPNTASDALNVWPDDVSEGRERGGSRSGLSKVDNGPAGSGAFRTLLAFNSAGDDAYDRELLAVRGSAVYRRSSAGTWAAQTGALDSSSGQLFAAQYGQAIYFADYDSGNSSYNFLDLSGTSVTYFTKSGADDPPADCTLIASWHDRIVLAGDPANPHVWYMSASGDPKNWDFGDDTATSAVAGSQFEGGLIGEPITALIPHNRKCLLFGTSDGLWVMRGDPIYEKGHIEVLSHEVGPITGSSWCKTAEGETVMLTRDGLYVMAAGCGTTPVSISRERLPDDLVNVDASTNTVLLEYDTMLRAVHIWITPSSGNGTHYLFDWETKSFWPISLADANFQPTAVDALTPVGSAALSPVILGGKDGDVRHFDRDATDDDGTSFSSHLVAGPMSISGGLDEAGIISEAYFLGESLNGEHLYKVQTGDTAESATTPSRTYTLASPNYRGYPRLIGQSATVRIESSGSNSSWLTEGGMLRVSPAGRMRR